MHQQRELNERAKAELETLKDQGITPTWQDVVLINALAWQIQSPTSEISSHRGDPIRVANAVLWPFSLQASDWWERHSEWFDDDLDTQTKALGYLMAHGRRVSLRARLASRPVARRAIFHWARSLKCTFAELQIAVGAVCEQMRMVENEIPENERVRSPEDDDKSGTSTGQLVAFLSTQTGIEPDFWERRACVPYIMEQIQSVIRQNQAEDKPLADDPRIIAERNLAYAIMQIEKRGIENGR